MLQTDPRLTNANKTFDVRRFKNEMTTKKVAEDIALAIRELGIQDYFVFGESYGTVVATVLASRLPAPGPRAIVLQGIVGHAFTVEETLHPYTMQWEGYLSSRPGLREGMSQRLRQLLSEGRITSADFTDFVGAVLLSGRDSEGNSYVDKYFGLFVGVDVEAAVREVK